MFPYSTSTLGVPIYRIKFYAQVINLNLLNHDHILNLKILLLIQWSIYFLYFSYSDGQTYKHKGKIAKPWLDLAWKLFKLYGQRPMINEVISISFLWKDVGHPYS